MRSVISSLGQLLPGTAAIGDVPMRDSNGNFVRKRAFYLSAFGISPNRLGDASPKITQALGELATVGGGTLIIDGGPGFRCLSPITMVENVEIVGEAQRWASKLEFPALTSGQIAIAKPSASNAGRVPSLRRLTITGPGGGTKGTPPSSKCFGVQQWSDGLMEDVWVTRFYAGIIGAHDHFRMIRVRATDNYIGYWFRDQVVQGHHFWEACSIIGNHLASVAVAGNSQFSTSTIIASHFGYGPYGIYLHDEVDADGNFTIARSKGGIVQMRIITTGFANIGNAAIYDASTPLHPSVSDSIVSSRFAWHTGNSIPGGNQDYAVKLNYSDRLIVTSEGAPFVKHAGGIAAFGIAGGSSCPVIVEEASEGQFTGSGSLLSRVVSPLGWEGRVYALSGTVAKGDALEFDGARTVKRFAGNTWAGIAQASGGSGDLIPVGQVGRMQAACKAVVSGNYLSPDGTTAYVLGPAPNANPSSPALVVGRADMSGGSSGNALARVLIHESPGWR
ncbi:MAG: hypothetical protein IT495_19685 [Gammaproteobacteria bacterium]|nr:hypothetical protein [Gammaproteobacteria bacterium]